MLNRFNHLVTGQFNNRANLAVPNHLVNLGDYQSARSRENMFISNEVERKRWLDEKLANIEANESRKYDNQLVRQAELNRETVRMIKDLEEYDKARRLRQDISDKTEIQEINSASYQPNEIVDNYEPRMQVNDYNSYEENALPYKQGGVSHGIWRGGSPSQYATFASDLLQPKTTDDRLFWQSSAEDNEKMNMNYPVYVVGSQVVTPLGLGTSSILAMNGRDPVRTTTAGIGICDYDPVFAHEVYEALRTDDCARAIWEEAKGIFGDVLLEQILDIMMLSAPPPLRTPIYVYMLLAGFCECEKRLRKEAVKKYKEEHHCSEEEARRNARYDKELLAEICTIFINEGLNHILKKWNWLPTDIQSILNSTIKSIAGRIVKYMTEQLF